MLETLAQIAALLAVFLFLPAFLNAFLILKEYRVSSLRFASYYKLLLFQVLMHSLFLFAALFYYQFKTAFIVHSFSMLPIYALLLFRLSHLKWHRQRNFAVQKAIMEDEQAEAAKAKQKKLLQKLRFKVNRKSQWH
ncbi:MAG: hypothetical protein RIC95_10700 [Vicingaceae bacterium]